MANLTRKSSEVAEYIYDMLVAAKDRLGLQEVYYGDQALIPKTPVVAVEAGPLERELQGAQLVTMNNFTVYLILYHAKISQSIQETNRERDALAEAIMDELNSDTEMGGLVIHGHVTNVDPGYTTRGGSLMRSARLTWGGISKTRLLGD